MLQVGDVLVGRYEIKALLGEGGMGAVYRAFDTLKQRKVAIKEFRLGDLPSEKDLQTSPDSTRQNRKTPSPLTREAALKLFKKEAHLLSPLEHPNLPQVYDFFILGEEGYIIMTLVEGKNLADLLEENGGPLPEEQVTGWLLQVLDALKYCHEKGVIHRDIKPDNLLLGDDRRIYLIDFGIAKVLNPGQQATSTGIRILSPGYAPPEQYSAKETADPHSDLYSLGATAHFLLTGEVPTEATERMVGEPLPAPRSLNPAISKRMDIFIQKCMKIPKEDRPQNAAEAAALLRGPQPVPPKSPFPQKVPTELVPPPKPLVPKPASRPRLNIPLRKMLAGIAGAALLGLLIWLVNWKMIPIIDDSFQHNQATRTVIVATRQGNAGLTDLAAAWTKTSTLTPSRTVTRTPTLTLTPSLTLTPTYTRTFTQTPTSTLIPPECTQIGKEWVSPIDGMTLVCVPAGAFTMGSNSGEGDGKPEHTVYLDAYWMDRTEVTNAQYAQCVAYGDCSAPDPVRSYTRGAYYGNSEFADYPVININWQQASEYCTWADRSLPIEAQWEKAARGTDGRIWPWGNSDPNSTLANFNQNVGDTTKVGIYPQGASPYGALDMAGNVWEWVADWYQSDYYATFPKDQWPDNPTGPESGTYRVLRGGTWSYDSRLRASSRFWFSPNSRNYSFGFRCSRSSSP